MNNPIHAPNTAPGAVGTQSWNKRVSPGVKCSQGTIPPVLFDEPPMDIPPCDMAEERDFGGGDGSGWSKARQRVQSKFGDFRNTEQAKGIR
jgi:hypothetical protein